MEIDTHSITAVLVAAARAYHAADTGTKIFDDHLASTLISASERAKYEEICIGAVKRLNPEVAATCATSADFVRHAQRLGAGTVPLLVRAQYVEQMLADAIDRGVRQYVIVGAGLDTFALRRLDVVDRLTVFEIDHPRSQAFKRERLSAAGVVPPSHLHFAAGDLERETLASVLEKTTFDPHAPAFFAWLGVAMYLSHDAILETFRSIAQIAASGSELVFDYLEPAAFAADAPLRIRLILQRVRELGEPMRSGLDPATLANQLSALGFTLLEDIGPDEVQGRFLRDHHGFRATEYWHVARAAVREKS